jgi:O-acetyl-ADP-ribose deacetylase (regulator of RNase III)
MKIQVHFRNKNPAFILSVRKYFRSQIAAGTVTASVGDVFEGEQADAVLSPANCFGYMDGGIDAAYTARFGQGVEARLQGEIRDHFDGELPVGQAVVVPTGDVPFAWLVAAPTMRIPMNVSSIVNAYLAFRAALIEIRRFNDARRRIESIVSPGMCTGIGGMPDDVAAHQMRMAWNMIVGGERLIRPEDFHQSQMLLERPPAEPI